MSGSEEEDAGDQVHAESLNFRGEGDIIGGIKQTKWVDFRQFMI